MSKATSLACCWAYVVILQLASCIALPLAGSEGSVAISCSPEVKTLHRGESTVVTCQVTAPARTAIMTMHEPSEPHDIRLQRDPTPTGFLFRIFFRQVTAAHGRRYCLTCVSETGTRQACYEIKVVSNEPVQSEASPPPRPEITDVVADESSITYGWRVHEPTATSSGEPFSTKVKVVSRNLGFTRTMVNGMAQATTFSNLQPNREHSISVITQRGQRTMVSERTVRTTPRLTVACPEKVDIQLRPYQYSATQPPPPVEQLRIKCNASIPVRDTDVLGAPQFLKVRATMPSHPRCIRISGRRNHRFTTSKNRRYCVKVHAENKQPVDGCFTLNVTRPLTAVIQDFCRSGDCSPSIGTAAGTAAVVRKVVGCYVTGHPLPDLTQVRWTYDGEDLSARTHAAWLRKILMCREVEHFGELVQLCKLKVQPTAFLSIDPGKLRCHAWNEQGSTAEVAGTADLLNRTELVNSS